MLASVRSAVLVGVDAHPVHVEVHVASGGLPAYNLVGLPDAAVRESRERIRAAIVASGLDWPSKRITVNLAPSGLRKSGAGLDLPAALGVLLASGVLADATLEGVGVIGELGLDGSLRPVPGTLALVDALRQSAVSRVLVPMANAAEASLVEGVEVLPGRSLDQVRSCLKEEDPWPDPPYIPLPPAGAPAGTESDEPLVDLGDVRGLTGARRALEVAVAGGHHLLLVGPPGAGKTLLAQCVPSILPPLSAAEALEVTKIHSAAGRPVGGSLLRRRPFRAPHHTASAAALIGGGKGPTGGEVTLAHRGALFLDELGEFAPPVLDALRQPLEERVVRISRAHAALTFPADFLLVACSNPCPCGLGPPACSCNPALRARYRRRLSGPLVDRFDLRVAVGSAAPDSPLGASSVEVAARVADAVARQIARYADVPWKRNARVPARALLSDITLEPEVEATLREAARRRQWTGRGLASIRRVARTLADLDGADTVSAAHVLVAAGMREDVLA